MCCRVFCYGKSVFAEQRIRDEKLSVCFGFEAFISLPFSLCMDFAGKSLCEIIAGMPSSNGKWIRAHTRQEIRMCRAHVFVQASGTWKCDGCVGTYVGWSGGTKRICVMKRRKRRMHERIRYVSMLLECIIALNETKTENNILVLLHSIFRQRPHCCRCCARTFCDFSFIWFTSVSLARCSHCSVLAHVVYLHSRFFPSSLCVISMAVSWSYIQYTVAIG